MEFQAVQLSVDRLVQWIRTGRLALPDFQRDFVWNPSQVVELLDSVAKQWPIGSLLLLSGPQPFGIRPIESGPPVVGRSLETYVLDGQQRLTSLYQAVSDVSDFCYYVDFRALELGAEDFLRWERRRIFEGKYPSLGARPSQAVALVKDVWDSDSFYAWLECIDDAPRKKSFVGLRDACLGGLQAKVYKVMAIQLDQEIQIEALARIFETLNRTGVRLNAFDLMVAILYPTGFRLRDSWEEARVTNDVFESYNIDPIEVLKLLALIIRAERGRSASKGVRQGDLLELDRPLIGEFWPKAVDLYATTLNFARNHLGVFSEEVMPASSMMLSLAAWIRAGNTRLETIMAWFWGSAFGLSYSQAANTVTVADFDAITEGRGPELAFERANQPFVAFEEPAKRSGLALRALACLLSAVKAVDVVSGEPLSHAGSVAYRVLDKDHVFRKATNADTFDRIVVVSKDSDRKLARAAKVPSFHQADKEERRSRFASQGIDIETGCRDLLELKRMVANFAKGA